MIRATSELPRYQTQFSNGKHQSICDVPIGKGGKDAGFLPFELLEAALACCVNITVRMYAENHGIALENVNTKVTLDRSQPEEIVFQYELELAGDLTEEERRKLHLAASACPVRRSLSKAIRFASAAETQRP